MPHGLTQAVRRAASPSGHRHGPHRRGPARRAFAAARMAPVLVAAGSFGIAITAGPAEASIIVTGTIAVGKNPIAMAVNPAGTYA
jgi:hypothetical protein